MAREVHHRFAVMRMFLRDVLGLDESTALGEACLLEHAWQSIEQWPVAARALLEAKDRVGPNGRVHMHERPEQFVVVVCGGLGNLHAIALATWGESTMQSATVTPRPGVIAV